jgi:hypothetical protein
MHCPYESVWKKMRASKKVCEVLTKIDESMAEAFCGEKIQLELAISLNGISIVTMYLR